MRQQHSQSSELDMFQGIGGAFFPEHHPCASWPTYVGRIADLGLSFVRIAEFTWDKLEPREGVFDFGWLDEVMGMLRERGVRAILCTPTAVPPIWACEAYPEIHPIPENGRTFGFGIRRYTCPTSPAYHRLSESIVSAMADHYAEDDRVLAWQIDNEVGHPFCFCPRCLQNFQAWCEQRYGTIAQFNDALCTHFLGQTFQQFGQISFPTTYSHPGMWQIYHQFFSEATIACFHQQAHTLRAHGVTKPITTNMMITWHGYDHEQMAKALDVVAGDHYGLGEHNLFGAGYLHELFTHAYLKGMKHGQKIWFHEFQWGRTGNMPLPGEVRWDALAHVGLGADLINFFRVDTCPSGMERDGYGLLGVHGQPGRVYEEVKQLSADLAYLKPLLDGSQPAPAEVAVLFTHANHAEFARTPKHPTFHGPSGNGYSMHLSRHYQAIARRNIPCDIVYPGDDFAKYRVIVAPALYILPRALAEKLGRFVEEGGTLLLSSFSGVADEHGRVWDIPVPGPLRGIAGIEVIDYGNAYEKAGAVRIVPEHPRVALPPLEGLQWIDEIRPLADDVEVLARFDNPFYAGIPALVRRPHGRGNVYYLGAVLEQEGYNQVYHALTTALGLRPLLELPDGLYAAKRQKGDIRLLFINNPTIEPRVIDLPSGYTDALRGTAVSDEVTLQPFEVLVLQEVDSKECCYA
jgi:beta-galactosidase